MQGLSGFGTLLLLCLYYNSDYVSLICPLELEL